jgi:hypothetical protein
MLAGCAAVLDTIGIRFRCSRWYQRNCPNRMP